MGGLEIRGSLGALEPPDVATAAILADGHHGLGCNWLNHWVAHVNQDYRALGIESGGTMAWFWIGPHKEYERLIGGAVLAQPSQPRR